MTVAPETWREVLAAIDAEAPPTLEAVDALADARDLTPADAHAALGVPTGGEA